MRRRSHAPNGRLRRSCSTAVLALAAASLLGAPAPARAQWWPFSRQEPTSYGLRFVDAVTGQPVTAPVGSIRVGDQHRLRVGLFAIREGQLDATRPLDRGPRGSVTVQCVSDDAGIVRIEPAESYIADTATGPFAEFWMIGVAPGQTKITAEAQLGGSATARTWFGPISVQPRAAYEPRRVTPPSAPAKPETKPVPDTIPSPQQGETETPTPPAPEAKAAPEPPTAPETASEPPKPKTPPTATTNPMAVATPVAVGAADASAESAPERGDAESPESGEPSAPAEPPAEPAPQPAPQPPAEPIPPRPEQPEEPPVEPPAPAPEQPEPPSPAPAPEPPPAPKPEPIPEPPPPPEPEPIPEPQPPPEPGPLPEPEQPPPPGPPSPPEPVEPTRPPEGGAPAPDGEPRATADAPTSPRPPTPAPALPPGQPRRPLTPSSGAWEPAPLPCPRFDGLVLRNVSDVVLQVHLRDAGVPDVATVRLGPGEEQRMTVERGEALWLDVRRPDGQRKSVRLQATNPQLAGPTAVPPFGEAWLQVAPSVEYCR